MKYLLYFTAKLFSKGIYVAKTKYVNKMFRANNQEINALSLKICFIIKLILNYFIIYRI